MGFETGKFRLQDHSLLLCKKTAKQVLTCQKQALKIKSDSQV